MPLIFHRFLGALLLLPLVLMLSNCQQATETANEPAASENSAAAPLAEKRPAPEFYIIAPDMAQNRVWICVDETSDIFHQQHDCSLLTQCQGTFRNLTLIRAVEDFGRYNCQVCSPELDHIFDDEMVR